MRYLPKGKGAGLAPNPFNPLLRHFMALPELLRQPPYEAAPPAPAVDPAPDVTPLWEDPTRGDGAPWPAWEPMPVSVCPEELVISEGRLLQMLKRHYGWICTEPGQLVKLRGRR